MIEKILIQAFLISLVMCIFRYRAAYASEFSGSYHLKGESQQEGVALLKKAGVRGYVFPEENGWITILAEEGPPYPHNGKLIKANDGLLVHYMCAEDHGWLLSIYRNNTKVFGYQCDWTDKIMIDDRETKLVNIKAIIGERNNIDEIFLHKLFYPREEDLYSGELPAYRVANLLGLTNFEWLSYDYVKSDGLKQECYKDVIEV